MNFLLESLHVLVMSLYCFLEAFVKILLPVGKKSIAGETVLITGAGSGIGRILGHQFATMDVTLVLWDINLDGVTETARVAKEKGARSVHHYQADCSDRAEVYRLAEKVKQEVGDVTILINNAGIVHGKKFMDTPDVLVEKTLHVNAMAHFWTYKAFLPSMVKKNHGHLVCIASSAGLIGVNGLADYCASKFAAVGFAESMALELIATGSDGIKTTIVCPYFVNTEMFNGCSTKWPRFLPILEPEYVAKRITNAILTDQTYLFMPRSINFLIFLKRVFFVNTLSSDWSYRSEICFLASAEPSFSFSHTSSRPSQEKSFVWQDKNSRVITSFMPFKEVVILGMYFGAFNFMDAFKGRQKKAD